jgi:hypothetical protein
MTGGNGVSSNQMGQMTGENCPLGAICCQLTTADSASGKEELQKGCTDALPKECFQG